MEYEEKVHFVITGGTIDSCFADDEGGITYEKTYLPEFLESLQLYDSIEFSELFMKDSRDITAEDRQEILETIKSNPTKRVILTHGSFTVADTTRYLNAQMPEDSDKVVIAVCSLTPLKDITPTDAGFNLGYAIAQSQTLKPGVYICMNGRVFTAEEAIKILKTGRFGSIYTK